MTKITTQVAVRSMFRSELRTKNRSWERQSCGVIAGLGGGILAGVVGSLVTFASWFMGGRIGQFEHLAGTVLLLLTIPLLVLGAHCLDLIERQKEKARRKQGET